MRRKSFIAIAATAASLIGAGSAYADTSSSTFEPPDYSHGSVAGQQGWKVLNPLFDQEVVELGGLPAAFGEHAWRVSNTYTVGSFEDQPYSPALTEAAGENEANTVFTGEFSFKTASDEYQPGLRLSVSPDDGHGARMAYVRLEDTPSGVRVFVDDVPNHYGGEFDERWIATLDRAHAHTIKFAMSLVPGEANDVVRVSVDGAAKDCGTSWENYYRYVEKMPEKAATDYVLPVSRMQFRMSGDAAAAEAPGVLIDNVTSTSAATGGPEACPLPSGPAGPAGAAGTTGAGSVQAATIQPPAARALVGNTLRKLHAQKRRGERLQSVRGWLRTATGLKRLPIDGKTVLVDLRPKPVGNYNVVLSAKYVRNGKTHTHRESRHLSVALA